jgi:hypothetical protein
MLDVINKGVIESHIAKIIKGHTLWEGYKNRLFHVEQILKKPELQTSLTVIKGNSYVRFKSNSDDGNLNSLFFIYEIEKIFPRLSWRHLIRGLTPILLNKAASHLPAFNFSLDQLTTLIYWGEQVPFLHANDLHNLKLRNFVLKINKPSSVEVSFANLVWPKSAYPLNNREIELFASYYIFNSLMPPILDGIDSISKIWFESPFVIIGDKMIKLFTLHKTLCIINENYAKKLRNGMINVRAKLIDRNFTVRQTLVDIHEEYFNETTKDSIPREVIFIKYINFKNYYEPEIKFRYIIYPFESAEIFKKESYGLLLTMLSIILRQCYLNSNDPFFFTIVPEIFKSYLSKISELFNFSKTNEFGLMLINNKDLLYELASTLGIYVPNGKVISYLHPALFGCMINNLDNAFNKDNLLAFQRIASEYNKTAKDSKSSDKISFIQNIFKKEFGYNLSFNESIQLVRAIHDLVMVCIPLSKALCLNGGS